MAQKKQMTRTRFYCSENINAKTQKYEWQFKKAGDKRHIVFASLNEAIEHLKSLRVNGTMWVRQHGKFVSTVKTRVGENPNEEVKVKIQVVQPKVVVSKDEEECAECAVLEADSKKWASKEADGNMEFCAECAKIESEVVEMNSSTATTKLTEQELTNVELMEEASKSSVATSATKDTGVYVLMNDEAGNRKPVYIVDENVNKNELDKYNDVREVEIRESGWKTTNYVLWFFLWFLLAALIIALVIVLVLGGY